MSERMRPLSFAALMNRAICENSANGEIYGIREFFKAEPSRRLDLFNEKVETPLGPAAGPHTQLAQNIISAYLCGARFFELKTVQTLDGEDLPVSKPCILAENEGYNVEWSTELRVPEAMDEYIKAWYAVSLLSRELGLGAPDGFVFNMSVGYDLEGIRSEKIDGFIEGLRDASKTEIWHRCEAWTLENLNRFKNIDAAFVRSISPKVCDSITLSTLHGCPPDEIERIATYLLGEKGLNTFIKLNPTLLGYEFARKALDALGKDYIVFDDHHFKADLQFGDAVVMLERLMKLAAERGLDFGVKLTNTFPVDITRGELPGTEMYMSGKTLFPLSVALAGKLSRQFKGALRISYSGGVDFGSAPELFRAGIWPITIATELLKPGGYERMLPIARALYEMDYAPFGGVKLGHLEMLEKAALSGTYMKKDVTAAKKRKLKSKAPLYDCYTAPCQSSCPLGQDIPAYLRLMEEGKPSEALNVILERNPLPHITGTICPHTCTGGCNRAFYGDSVYIREIKLWAANVAGEAVTASLKPAQTTGERVGIIGGGPIGVACSHLLARRGFEVTVFEKAKEPGGVPLGVIPDFRIEPDMVRRDVKFARALGVKFECGREVSVAELRGLGFEKIVIAVGASSHGARSMEYGGELNALDFLRSFKSGPRALRLGEAVAVIGGGNTAMDCARAAKRAPGVKTVYIIYRRTVAEMPADLEELELAASEGVSFVELTSPIGLEGGVLKCRRMALGERDESGRARPVDTGETVDFSVNTVISATGERIDAGFFSAAGVELDSRGRPVVNPATLETGVSGLYVIGDCKAGPATVAKGIADALLVASAISGAGFDKYGGLNSGGEVSACLAQKGCPDEGKCLDCASVCELCADVCPNRANVAVVSGGRRQIVHIDSYCNECGNCETFCPYTSAPYKVKFTVFDGEADFNDSENDGFAPLGGGSFLLRLDGKTETVARGKLPELALSVLDEYGWLVR